MAGYGQQWGAQAGGQQAWGAQGGGQQQGWGQQQQQQAWAQQQQQQPAQSAWGQQQAGGWGQQQAAPQQQANKHDVTLVVTGCTHGTVGGIVRGTFQLHGENHGKPTYKKDGQVNGLDVMTYYWDERDGPGFCGWWFGPKVGGDQVWAYHTEKADMPPSTGWKVPYDGPVDPTFVISQKPKGGAAQQQQAQQGWGQQQQGWGQQGQQAQMAKKMEEQKRLEEQRKQMQMQQQQQQQQRQQQQGWGGQGQAAAQQKLAENRQKLEQANAKRIEDQKKKMEEMKAQQQLLIQKRAEEQKKKEAEAEAKKIEQQAVLKIRRVMQKFRASPADRFEDNKKELDEEIAKELENCGSQKERLATEIEQAVVATKQRIEQMAEMKKKEEEKKEAALKVKKEQREKSAASLKELEGLVETLEAKCKGVAEEAEPLTEEKEMKVAEIEACASAVKEASVEANSASAAVEEFMKKESANIKNCPPIPGEPNSTAGADLNKLVQRISEAKKLSAQSSTKANNAKTQRIKKAEAKAKYEKTLTSFKKYDADKDSKLSRKEVAAFAKGEYKFTVPADCLDTVCRVLISGSDKGVTKEKFNAMKVMIGVAREAAIDAKRKADREKREKLIADKKEKMQASAKEIAEVIAKVAEVVAKAEKEAAPLTPLKAKGMTSVEMLAAADAADAVVEDSKTQAAAAKKAVTDFGAGAEPELKGFVNSEVQKLQNNMRTFEPRNTKVGALLSKWRSDAAKKAQDELGKLRKDGIAMIHYHMAASKLDLEGGFKGMKPKDGKIREGDFVKFFKTCKKKEGDDGEAKSLGEEDAARLFQSLDSEEVGYLDKEMFMNLVRKFMKVMKAAVITEEIGLKSKIIRRLEEGEVLEVLMGPTTEEGADVERIKAKATKDDVEGWVTPVGTGGSVFLEQGGNLFKVVKETILTGSFVIGGDTKIKDRKLKVGEICEVREWAKKEETSGLMRMKVMVKSDGQSGYVTTVGNTGIKFMEVM